MYCFAGACVEMCRLSENLVVNFLSQSTYLHSYGLFMIISAKLSGNYVSSFLLFFLSFNRYIFNYNLIGLYIFQQEFYLKFITSAIRAAWSYKF